jgi:hypothetical protein
MTEDSLALIGTLPVRTKTLDPRPWTPYSDVMTAAGYPLPEHGPWETEPDEVYWVDLATGYPCVAKRGYSGGWCGYVCVPRKHPWYRKIYSSEPYDTSLEALIEVHGGLTYSGPLFGEGDWWFGFDCNHAWDLIPGFSLLGITSSEQAYRTIGYVIQEIISLASQLKLQMNE